MVLANNICESRRQSIKTQFPHQIGKIAPSPITELTWVGILVPTPLAWQGNMLKIRIQPINNGTQCRTIWKFNADRVNTKQTTFPRLVMWDASCDHRDVPPLEPVSACRLGFHFLFILKDWLLWLRPSLLKTNTATQIWNNALLLRYVHIYLVN